MRRVDEMRRVEEEGEGRGGGEKNPRTLIFTLPLFFSKIMSF